MSYASVFGGNTIYPSDVSLLALALTADVSLDWPLANAGTDNPVARIMDVTPDASGYSITMPDATEVSPGQTVLFNNLSGSYSFTVKDAAGGTIATIDFGEQWELYLASNATAAGTWRSFMFGASTATVQPSAIAGYGLIPTGSTVSQSMPVTTFSTSGTTISTSNRAGAFVWDDTGAGTLNLLPAATAGNNFFVNVRNAGGGDLTIDPDGSETINGASTLILRPGDSAILITDGSEWFTIGYGQEAVFAFDYTSIAVTGGTYTLSGSELNRIAYNFTGTLTSDVTIVVPSTVQQYWVSNNTSGSYLMYIKTSGGSAVQLNQGAKAIYYSNGTDIILGTDPLSITTPLAVSDGGTGATTASAARLNLGITAFADTIVTASSGATVRTAISAAASGANSDITSLSALSTPLSIAQGGTSAATASGARTALGLDTMATQAASAVAITGGTIAGVTLSSLAADLAVTEGGTGASTAADARTNLGAAASGTNADITSATALVAITATGGLDVGSATGGVQGDGTINAKGLYVDGVAVGSGSGSVTSVAASGGSTGLSFSGSPITTSGTLTLTGTLALASGGTGATTASGARSALGLGSLATQSTISNNDWSGTDLAIANGGTGASTASAALAALGGLGVTASSIASSGYMTLSNGLKIQWGSGSLGANSTGTVTFGSAYSSWARIALGGGNSDVATEGDVHISANPTTTGVAIANSANVTGTYNWIAVGV